MKRNLAKTSWLMFGLCVIFWLALTLFESALAGTSFAVQRAIIFLLLVFPAGTGAVFGLMSLLRKEGRALQAVISTVLNSLFALFHILIILFAG